jgi:hypothetical protein
MLGVHASKALIGLVVLLACLSISSPAHGETSAHRLERKLRKLERQTGELIRNAGQAAFEGPLMFDGNSKDFPRGCLLDNDDDDWSSKPAAHRSPPAVPRKAN